MGPFHLYNAGGRVESFLSRVESHSDRCFVLLQADVLATNAQQLLLKHMLQSRAGAALGQNLHCVQTGGALLQAAHWVDQHKSATTISREQAEQMLCGVLDSETICSVQYLIGGAGSGKTHHAKKQLAAWEHAGRGTCVFSLTEGFCESATAHKLHEMVLQHGRATPMGVCFHINLGKFKCSERDKWDSLMNRINQFFFSLLVR